MPELSRDGQAALAVCKKALDSLTIRGPEEELNSFPHLLQRAKFATRVHPRILPCPHG
jgi:hypothetical protein